MERDLHVALRRPKEVDEAGLRLGYDGRAMQVATFLDHEDLKLCDKLLRETRKSESFTSCQPSTFTCICGRRFVHVCDEAEGCSYVLDA